MLNLKSMKEEDELLHIDNLQVAEEMYAKYLADKDSVEPSWKELFANLKVPLKKEALEVPASECNIQNLINAYRSFGHLMARINPLEDPTVKKNLIDELKLENFNLSEKDLTTPFFAHGLIEGQAPLSQILERLSDIYLSKIGVEAKNLQNKELELFIQKELEKTPDSLSIDEKRMILHQLNRSELLEVFLHTKYVGQKRFSLEGGETLIPMLQELIEKGAEEGVEEVYIGMSHRGRLNVLTNILNKPHTELFSEFDEMYIPDAFEGSYDVKYHKGFKSEIKTAKGKKVKIVMASNPSHLESVDAVIEGQAKARQLEKGEEGQKKVLPVLVHGDAAISGQGVVYETLQFSKLSGYSTGGTLHFIVNNQIGFTTAPKDARSTPYCTDIAKAFGAPVFHVNEDDPEGAVFITKLALKIRQKFQTDVFIDLNCYRKYGHNESDEPSFTQPHEYHIIRKKKPVREVYLEQLLHEGALEKEIAEKAEKEFKDFLQEQKNAVKIVEKEIFIPETIENGIVKELPVKTAVSKEEILKLAEAFCKVQEGFDVHPKIAQLTALRLGMAKGEKPIDWGMAEHLAYATLLVEGVNIRLSGQDSCRGTFSHRHGLFVSQKKEEEFFPLQHLNDYQGRFDLINSPLSEFAALGFEYGYSMEVLEDLTIWEAQFGDFANSAQVIIDQYIASGEQKWGQRSSLTLLLPHGFEGQGPEHSSGRLERFLNLAGDNNMQIVNPTTPVQFFHLVRRQVLSKVYKPLIVFTPKGLLRHSECVSTLKDFTEGTFQTVLEEENPKKQATHLIFCSGRIYFDLLEAARKEHNEETAILRIEQLYPLDIVKLKDLIATYKNAKTFSYVQEEPSNMGAYEYLRNPLLQLIPKEKQ
ncbi:MAG TPA: 2-oxoglutarate dehydrogenase E1 component, partial [Parachlamydiaceae bacterium]|nr:2-oxoglutarate dehydrogenase E1 component [Parachlamydiaceae bacterium]